MNANSENGKRYRVCALTVENAEGYDFRLDYQEEGNHEPLLIGVSSGVNLWDDALNRIVTTVSGKQLAELVEHPVSLDEVGAGRLALVFCVLDELRPAANPSPVADAETTVATMENLTDEDIAYWFPRIVPKLGDSDNRAVRALCVLCSGVDPGTSTGTAEVSHVSEMPF